MDWSNIRINFLGDSITQGAGASKYDNCFVKIIERNMGAVCRNYGIGGTRIARQRIPSSEKIYDMDFCSRIEQMDDDANVVVIFGGTNDFGHGDAPMGAVDDRTPNTFYGALHYLYSNIINKYPDAFIFLITPMHRLDENNPRGEGEKEIDGPLLRQYVHAIKEVAEYYSLPVLDLFATSGIYPTIAAHREKYTPDGLHPNDIGHEIIAKRIIEFIENYYIKIHQQ